MMDKKKDILHIIGAGPAGLAVAYYAKKKNLEPIIYESSENVGGNCRTIIHGDFKFDLGAHRFHDKISEITEELISLIGDDFLQVNSPSKIFWENKMIQFPPTFQDLFQKLGKNHLKKIIIEKIFNLPFPSKISSSFQDYVYQQYGKTLSNLFLINYSEKLWGQSANLLSTEISGGRLNGLNLSSVIKKFLLPWSKVSSHLDGSFYYPRNGFGTIFDLIKDNIGPERIKFKSPVKKIFHDGHLITQVIYNNKKEDVETLISTFPLSSLIKAFEPSPPIEIKELVDNLKYRNLKLCAIFLDIPNFTDNASLYFPESIYPFTRIYEPKNRSKDLAPEGKTCIVAEIPFSDQDNICFKPDDQIMDLVINFLEDLNLISKDNIIDKMTLTIDFAYPILDVNIKQKVSPVFKYLAQFKNLHLMGRSSEFKYTHTHSIFHNAKTFIDSIDK